jgi:predicted nucleotidyltransferase component of viral defense system
MIDPEEIKAKSLELKISIADVQRDYVFAWLLGGVFTETTLSDRMALKGGNALRKIYLPNTRFSQDLDFTTSQEIPPNEIVNELNKACDFAQHYTGVEFIKDKNIVSLEPVQMGEKLIYKGKVYFKSFDQEVKYYPISIRVDVTEFDELKLGVNKGKLIHSYSDRKEVEGIEIPCAYLEEILADKLKCMIQRRHASDLYDLVHVVLINPMSIEYGKVVSTFLQKTIFEQSPTAAKDLLIKAPLDKARQFWAKVVAPVAGFIAFDDALTSFPKLISDLFTDFSYGDYQALAYFPAEIRYPIIEGGSNRTLVRIGYHGHQRLVEPYSITYKRRQDGVAQEYLYAYDTTGGNSPPGLKRFLHQDIVSIENTDIQYVPRDDIALNKAGDKPDEEYFSEPKPRPFRTAKRRSVGRISRPRTRSYGPTYVIRCGLCNKTFNRKSLNTILRPHKTRDSYTCYNGVGYLEDTRF